MYNPSIWSSELAEGRRQYVASVLLNNKGRSISMLDLGKSIGVIAQEPVPAKYCTDSSVFHASGYRRFLSGDIDALNRDPRFPYSIISDNKGVRICNSEEMARLYKMERKEALKKLAKCSIIARKAGLDGQITVTGDEVRAFMETEATA